jgi:uncharacterized membrane protein
MNKLLGFIRTTLVGGLLFLVPIIVLGFVIGKAMGIAHHFVPLFEKPIESMQLGHILTPGVFAALLVVLFCFAAGLFARTAPAKGVAGFLDSRILINIPGYALFRSMSGGSAGIESFAQQPVLVAIEEEAWQIAFVVEKLSAARIAVYVPGVPEARSGSLYFLAPDRVKPMDISPAAAFQVLRRMGVGSGELLKNSLATQ